MRGLIFNGSQETLVMLLPVFTVGIAALIPISTGAGRWMPVVHSSPALRAIPGKLLAQIAGIATLLDSFCP